MTKERIRVVIAEHLGWTRCCIHPDTGMWRNIPDFCDDLNACYEFEARLANTDPVGWNAYNAELLRLDWPCHATAEERATAMCRTIGRWEDDK